MSGGASFTLPRASAGAVALWHAYRRNLPFDAFRGNDPAMMGRDHALSGALVFAALATSLHVSGAHLAAGVALSAGAGMLPDIDHPDTTISRSFGFLTQAFAWLVDRLSGGHRHGTHSFVGIAVFTAGAFAAGSTS